MSGWPDGVANPGLLPILLAAFLPVLLHILDRRRARVVDWPAVRFLIAGDRRRIRRWRAREALLLLVRTLVALLVAVTVLRPFSRELTAVQSLPPANRGVVLVLDTSSSMTYRGGTGKSTSLDRAKAAAARVLETVDAGAPLGWIATGSPGAISSLVLRDVAAGKTALEEVRPGGGRFQLLQALDAAGDLLVDLPQTEQEIWVFTDLQATSAKDDPSSRWSYVMERLRSSGATPRVRIADCGFPEPRNRFLSSVATPPLAVATREEFALEATVEGAAPDAAPLSARLVVDGIEEAEARIAESPEPILGVQLEARLDRAGTRRLELSLPPDGLPGDDTLAIPLEAFDEIRVLLVGPGARGSRGVIPASDADYVDLALVPRTPGETQPTVIFAVERTDDPTILDLSVFQVVVVSGQLRATGDLAASLESFVSRGGGLLVFVPPELDPESWTTHLYQGGRGVLPARPVPGVGAPSGGLRPRDIDVQHPALAVFSGGEEGDLSSVLLRRWTRWADVAPEARTLARIDEETPWILERRFGSGRVIVVGTSSSPRDSDLPTGPLFLPLVHQLVRYLAAPELDSSLHAVGSPIVLDVPTDLSDAGAWLVRPDGSRTRVSPTWIDGRRRVVVEAPTDPGFYELRATTAPADRPASRVFACRIPSEESRLDRLDAESLREIETGLGARIGADPRRLLETTHTEEERHEWWRGLVGLILALALVEIVLTRGFAARVSDTPTDTPRP
jgi:hypothetical protein